MLSPYVIVVVLVSVLHPQFTARPWLSVTRNSMCFSKYRSNFWSSNLHVRSTMLYPIRERYIHCHWASTLFCSIDNIESLNHSFPKQHQMYSMQDPPPILSQDASYRTAQSAFNCQYPCFSFPLFRAYFIRTFRTSSITCFSLSLLTFLLHTLCNIFF